MGRRSYSGNAVPTVLSGGIGALDLTFTVQDATGYPTGGAAGPFYVTLARGAAGEEKVLCDSRSGLTFTVNATGRGADGTVATSHAASSTTVEHTITKTDLDEANAHVNDTTGDPHPQYLTPAEGSAAYATKTELAASTSLIALKEYRPGSLTAVSTTSTSLADVDAVNAVVTFTVPSSGLVLVEMEALAYVAAESYFVQWGLREGAADVTHGRATGSANADRSTISFRVDYGTGAAGTSKTLKFAHRVSAAGTGTTAYGGDGGPLLMKVWKA